MSNQSLGSSMPANFQVCCLVSAAWIPLKRVSITSGLWSSCWCSGYSAFCLKLKILTFPHSHSRVLLQHLKFGLLISHVPRSEISISSISSSIECSYGSLRILLNNQSILSCECKKTPLAHFVFHLYSNSPWNIVNFCVSLKAYGMYPLLLLGWSCYSFCHYWSWRAPMGYFLINAKFFTLQLILSLAAHSGYLYFTNVGLPDWSVFLLWISCLHDVE